MVAALSLGEITINHCQYPGRGINIRHNQTALGIFIISCEAFAHGNRLCFGQQGDTVMGFLAVIKNVVAEVFQVIEREHLVMDFGFLEADNIRLMLCDNRFQLVRPGS